MKQRAPHHFHFDARVRLQDLINASKAEGTTLPFMMKESKIIFDYYVNNEEVSAAARKDYYQRLYQANHHYYQTKIYQKKSGFKKFLNFFGIRPRNEKIFLRHIRQIADRMLTADVITKANWKEGRLIKFVTESLKTPKGDPSTYLKSSDDNRNQELRLTVHSHRLMRHEEFKSKKYEHFHGIPFELSAYKMKRAIEKFAKIYQNKLSPEQLATLTDCVTTLEKFIEFKKDSVYSKFLSLNKTEGNAEQRFDDIIFKVHQQLHQLPIGQRLLVPHGYMVEKEKDGKKVWSGHATLVEFERIDEFTYKISFINTGAGLHEQERGFIANIKLQFLRILNVSYVDNVTQEEIRDKDLIKSIFSSYFVAEKSHEQAVAKMNAPINMFADRLHQTDHRINMQVNGTCAFSCLLEWLGWRLDQGLFRALDLFMNNRSVEKLAKFNNNPVVNPNLKTGVDDLLDAGRRLVDRNRENLHGWLAANQPQQVAEESMDGDMEQSTDFSNAQAISAFSGIYKVAKEMGIEYSPEQPANSTGFLNGLFRGWL